MKTSVARFASAFAGFALIAVAGAVGAAELKVFSTTALTEVWQELKPRFEARGHKLELVLQPSGAIGKRVAGGEAGDAIVSTTAGIEGLEKSGKIAAGTTRACEFRHGSGGAERRTQARYFHCRGVQEHAAGGEIGRLLRSGWRRRERCCVREAAQGSRHRRGGQCQGETRPRHSECRIPDQRRIRHRDPADSGVDDDPWRGHRGAASAPPPRACFTSCSSAS